MGYDCFCDYDPAQFYRRVGIKVARKEFRCDECNHRIRPGDRYERVTAKWDFGIATFITCEHCVELRNWAQIYVPCFCWAHGNLLQDITDMVEQVRHDVPGFFFEYGRRLIAARRAKSRPSIPEAR